MTIIFIDGFDDYKHLDNKWDIVYGGSTIAQGVGKRNSDCLQIDSSYFDNTSCLRLNFNNPSSTIITGFAYKRPALKTPSFIDIAYNKPVKSSNVVAPYSSRYAVDGSKSSMWIGTTLTWIRVDLGEVKNICGFGLECYYGGSYSWSYYGSNNDIDWFLIASMPTTLFQGLITTSGIDINYRYVRVNPIPSSGSLVRVVSFQVYEYLNNTRDDRDTIMVSFSNNGLKRCSLELGFKDLSLNYNYDYNEPSGVFKNTASWGENFFNNYRNTTEDCYMWLASPNTVYSSISLAVGCGNDGSRISRSQLKFDLNYLKNLKESTHPSLTIFKATLYLYVYLTYGAHTISVYRSLQNWTESQTTYNSFRTGSLWNQPGASASNPTIDIDDGVYDRSYSATDSTTISNSYIGWVSFDITNLANKWIDGSIKQYGVHIKSNNEEVSNYVMLYSSEDGGDGLRPYLNIDYGTVCSGIKVDDCLVSGTWNYVESKINFDTGDVEIRIDESTVLTASGLDMAENQINSMEIYSNARRSSEPYNHAYAYVDDLYVATASGSVNNDFLGVCLVDIAYPSFSGTNNDYMIKYYYDDKRYEVIDSSVYSYDYINEFTITSDIMDGYFSGFQTFSTTTTTIRWEQSDGSATGYSGKSFFRFKGINIPRNAIILDARLLITISEALNTDFIYMDGRFERSGTPTIAPISQVDLENRNLTSIESRALWRGAYSLSNGKSENLKNSLQELVSRPDWQEENNTVTVIVGFGGYYNYNSYIRLYSYEYPTVSYRPKLYIKWKLPLIYDMSEYLYSQNAGKDTYYYDISTSGIDLLSLSDICAISHNFKSKYVVNTSDYSLSCSPLFIISGTEYIFDEIDYTIATISGSYINNSIVINQNPITSTYWTGEDLSNIEVGSIVI